MHARFTSAIVFVVALSGLAGCSGTVPSAPSTGLGVQAGNVHHQTSPINHIVILVQENRSFDNLFATFPGADGATSGYYLRKVNGKYVRTYIALKESPLPTFDFNHSWKNYISDYDNGGMD